MPILVAQFAAPDPLGELEGQLPTLCRFVKVLVAGSTLAKDIIVERGTVRVLMQVRAAVCKLNLSLFSAVALARVYGPSVVDG